MPKGVYIHKPISTKTRRKMSKAKAGVNNPMFGIMGRPAWNKGKKGVQVAWNKGKRGLNSGKNNPNWRGGVTPFIHLLRNLPEYIQWRSDVFQRDRWTCQTCGKRSEGDLEAHHIKPVKQILKENTITNTWQAQICAELWDIDNGVTLCAACHSLIDKCRGRFTNKGGK